MQSAHVWLVRRTAHLVHSLRSIQMQCARVSAVYESVLGIAYLQCKGSTPSWPQYANVHRVADLLTGVMTLSSCCRVPEAQQWLGAAMTNVFMAQGHFIMAYLATTGSDEKWAIATKLYMGASEDFDSTLKIIEEARAAGCAVLNLFQCAQLLCSTFQTVMQHSTARTRVVCTWPAATCLRSLAL
jgi:hypothetical protein